MTTTEINIWNPCHGESPTTPECDLAPGDAKLGWADDLDHLSQRVEDFSGLIVTDEKLI